MNLDLDFSDVQFLAWLLDQQIPMFEKIIATRNVNDAIAVAQFMQPEKNISFVGEGEDKDEALDVFRELTTTCKRVREQIRETIGM